MCSAELIIPVLVRTKLFSVFYWLGCLPGALRILHYSTFRTLGSKLYWLFFTGEVALGGLKTLPPHTQNHRSATGTQIYPGPTALSVAVLHQCRKFQHVLHNAQQETWSLWDQVGEWMLVRKVPRAATCQMSLGCATEGRHVCFFKLLHQGHLTLKNMRKVQHNSGMWFTSRQFLISSSELT